MESTENFRTSSSPKLFNESSTGSISSGQSEQSSISGVTNLETPIKLSINDLFSQIKKEKTTINQERSVTENLSDFLKWSAALKTKKGKK